MPHAGIIYRLIAISAAIVIAGIILSGAPALYLVSLIQSQPDWVDMETYAANYHPIQNLPWAGGFILILGFTFFIASASHLAVYPYQKVPATLAVVFVTVYAVIIGTNYTLQIAWVPVLLRQKKEVMSMFTMSNPHSLGWILEVFGYAFLGLSTWCISMVFRGTSRMHLIRYLLLINGVVSITGAIITTRGVSWISDIVGVIGYIAWNILVLVMMGLIYHEFRRKRLRGVTK